MTSPSLFFVAFSFALSCYSANAKPSSLEDFSFTANRSTTWTNNDYNESSFSSYPSSSSYMIQPILVRETNGSTLFGCGFYCDGTNLTSCHFAIFIFRDFNFYYKYISEAEVVWSANRDNLVRNGAILNFTAAGELVLKDVEGKTIWTTNTTGKSVTGMNLTDTGNLVLFDVQNSVVWQSFDHPTDTLLLGEKLAIGQKLIPSVSETNWSSQQGLFSLQFNPEGLRAYVGSNPPQLYYTLFVASSITDEKTLQLAFMNESLQFLNLSSTELISYDSIVTKPLESSTHYVKLMPDGHLRVFEWLDDEWNMKDLFEIEEECGYPLACGRNSLCTANQQFCSCPTSNNPSIDYFRAVNPKDLTLGCSEITPLTCNATEFQDFMELKNVAYFAPYANMEKVNMETCKQACLNNCSCKAAFFRNDFNSSIGECILPSELFTMRNVAGQNYVNASAFIKVQNFPSSKKENRVAVIEASTIGSFVLLLAIVVAFTTFIAYKRKRNAEMDEEYLDQVPGMPIRFSHHALEICTENYSKKLGEGGFGSVFEGTLEDGSEIAVKRLEGLAQVKKSFLAEVESIGSIHQVNLVRLKGFCAWKSHRLLIYEFMSNGSLDRWIYHGDRQQVLTWECRKKIVFDIAKGLAYLHEECSQKIIHLDIKPQNILLDHNFNAKISDFGLSKLIDKNQSHVMTTMRGTPGYMAPEWLSSIITEKVDVYSFGIVVLEILCGRKNFDRRQPEESWHLLGVIQQCWEQGKLLDLVDKHSDDMQAHGSEVMEMLKVASWCLQTDFTRRPTMSTVIKVLEGAMNVNVNLDYNFSDPRLHKTKVEHKKDSTPLVPSVLSQPR